MPNLDDLQAKETLYDLAGDFSQDILKVLKNQKDL
jgi:hypothetical protein